MPITGAMYVSNPNARAIPNPPATPLDGSLSFGWEMRKINKRTNGMTKVRTLVTRKPAMK